MKDFFEAAVATVLFAGVVTLAIVLRAAPFVVGVLIVLWVLGLV